MIRRIGQGVKWIVPTLLLIGSAGCSTWSGSPPVPESLGSLPFDEARGLDLAPSVPVQRAGESGRDGNDARQAEDGPDAIRPAAEQTRAEAVPADSDGDGSPRVVPHESSTLLLAQTKESQGPGGVVHVPEPEKDENYDPFAKPGEKVEFYNDPLEPFNRAMFGFNRKFDEYVLHPVAKVYEKVVPDGVEQGISNMFNNVRTVPRLFNNIFQGKFKGAGIEASRLVINSSLGIGGFLDFAKEVFELETPPEDTGQTLGVYGVGPGPYLVVPFLGSFTIRDGFGFIGDLALDPFNWLLFPFVVVDGWPQVVTNEDTILFAQLGIRAGYFVNERAINIDFTFADLEKSTADVYEAVRNAYLQKRAQAIAQ